MNKPAIQYTPMMMQYLGIKEKYPDTLIFFRLGDFYELFFEDAKIASRELSLVLTGKNAGREEKVPMCGVPHHASKSYISKLIDKGYRVGIVEQLEEAKPGKGIVDRDVVQMYTPGAYIEGTTNEHNFIACVSINAIESILVFMDVSTGDVIVENASSDIASVVSALEMRHVKEVVIDPSLSKENQWLLKGNAQRLVMIQVTLEDVNIPLSLMGEEKLVYQRLLSYLLFTQKRELTHLLSPVRLNREKLMSIDGISIKNLEIVQNLKNQEKYGSLYWLLDETETAMGSRLLKERLQYPSFDRVVIEQRLDIVEALMKDFLTLESLKMLLKEVYDLPRIITKIHFQSANARDLLSLKKSLLQLPSIVTLLANMHVKAIDGLIANTPLLKNEASLLDKAIDDEPPVSVTEGGLIKKGYLEEIDRLKALSEGGQTQLMLLEKEQRTKTGIKNLKVGFNKVFGYYIEISNGQLNAIKPEFEYERRQTLANGERFITKELKALESTLLSADEKRIQLEKETFFDILLQLTLVTEALQTVASMLAMLDVYASFASVSHRYRMVRPSFNQQRTIELVESRHPVIEKVMKASRFVHNDFQFSSQEEVCLITGPNMGGKSTFMRQVALTVILAQIGCFVPAKHANFMLFDAIFTRIGASDDLVGGQSTFMMEMAQTNLAIQQATEHSLLIFDEIGRGTATFDGMALAQAILEYILEKVHAKTLFSTHYHELTHLSEKHQALVNMHATVVEEKDNITFMYKIKRGTMSRSYGIHVAKLAELPLSIIERAKTILIELEKQDTKISSQASPLPVIKVSEVEAKLKALNLENVTPLEALHILDRLKRSMK
jgi:DNA mismatch repair protein MutS